MSDAGFENRSISLGKEGGGVDVVLGAKGEREDLNGPEREKAKLSISIVHFCVLCNSGMAKRASAEHWEYEEDEKTRSHSLPIERLLGQIHQTEVWWAYFVRYRDTHSGTFSAGDVR